MLYHSQQKHSNHHQRQHPNYKRDSPKATPSRRKQSTSIVVARSKILGFHPGESRNSKTMPSTKPLPGTTNEGQTLGFHPEIEARYSRSTTKDAVHLCCYPRLPRLLLLVAEHPDTQGTCVALSSSQPIASLPKAASGCSRHVFLHLCRFHGNLYEDMSHGTNKKTKLRASPKKRVHDRIDSTLDVQ